MIIMSLHYKFEAFNKRMEMTTPVKQTAMKTGTVYYGDCLTPDAMDTMEQKSF